MNPDTLAHLQAAHAALVQAAESLAAVLANASQPVNGQSIPTKPDNTLEGQARGRLRNLLTGKEVCALLRISRSTLWRLVKSGKINVVHVLGQNRFNPCEVERCIARLSRSKK